jgi:hypothetical protein
MTPQSFEFRLSMPGDARLVGAVRDLTTHAAAYARFPAEALQQVVELVAGATAAVIAGLDANDANIDYEYAAGDGVITVTIGYSAAGTRQTRQIQQRVP